MTYLEKEEQFIKRCQETNWGGTGNKDMTLRFLERNLKSFTDYALKVIHQETQMKIINAKYEGQEFRDFTQELDTHRKNAHDAACKSITALNRFCCDRLNMEPFADIDTTDRHQVAKFIGDYTHEIYNKGIGEDAAERTKQRIADYDRRFGHLQTTDTQPQLGGYEH